MYDPTRKRITEMIARYRLLCRDTPAQNLLLQAQESSDRQVAMALIQYVDWFNGRPPHFTPYTVETFPAIYTHLWLEGMQVILLDGVLQLAMRNFASWSDGGQNFNLEARAPLLQGYLADKRSRVESAMDAAKASQNLEMALDTNIGVYSEYAGINTLTPTYILSSN